ncbi:hypothetical protein GGI04_002800 [Coemansia thaxteri]|nr:hypothetical protein GGI04_002800 [Coemansia thaxteri]
MYTTPPGARRALTTAPHTTGGMSRVGSGESARLRSQAEFDHFNERSIATTLGLDSQLSRFAYDDGSARAHVPGRHARGNSVASPTTRARAIEDARSALTGGPRHVAASDSFAWGSPQAYQGAGSRARTGSLAVQEPGPRVRHPNRASYAGSAAASFHASSAAPGSTNGGAARRVRRQSQQLRGGRTAIRSNWYHRDEMLHEGDLQGQEFASSDEEDFGEDRDYGGDMVSQQRLIQKQQREIFDLNMRCKMLSKAMAAKTDQPYEALADDYGRTCASNRKANRRIEQLLAEAEDLRAQFQALSEQTASPPPCPLPHGMSDEDRASTAILIDRVEELTRNLDIERSMNLQHRARLDQKDALCRDAQDRLEREQLNCEQWHCEATRLRQALEVLQHQQPPSAAAAATELLSSRTRAGTATTMSETVTLRAMSDISVGAEDMSRAAFFSSQNKQETLVAFQNLEILNKALKEKNTALESQLDKAVAAHQQSETERRRLEADLLQARKKVRDLENQRRLLQHEMKYSQDDHKVAENDALREENDVLRGERNDLIRQLASERDQAGTTIMAALSNVDLGRDGDEDDEEAGGSASRRAEIAKLKVECRDLQNRCKAAQDHAENVQAELNKLSGEYYRLKHEVVRPYIRETTVGPAQAEALQIVVPPSPEFGTVPTTSRSGRPQRGLNSADSSPSLLAQSDDSFVCEQQQQQSATVGAKAQSRLPLSASLFEND